MARPPKLSPEQIQIIRDARRAGSPAVEIARETGTSLRSVQRALAGAAADESLDAAPTLAALGAESAITGRDPLVIATATLARVAVAADREIDAGNVVGYTGLLRQQTLLLTAVRQLEAQRASESAPGKFFTNDELRAGEALVYERLKALEADARANGGMVCVKCGESLRIADAEANGDIGRA